MVRSNTVIPVLDHVSLRRIDSLSLRDFWISVRTGAKLVIPKPTVDSPKLDANAIEQALREAPLWLTTRTVASFLTPRGRGPMSLADDLLEQAVQLATLDSRRPKQANLRRAVSSAYYAFFHLLTGEAARTFASGSEFVAASAARTTILR